MDINNYSYAPHMLDDPRDREGEQDIKLCATCENLGDAPCDYKKANCNYKEMA